MEDDDLKKQIDELFRLFRKVMEKYPPDDVPGMDKAQMEQLKAYLTQYDSIKDQFSVEMFGMMDNGMARQFISMLTNKLREQLGEDADIDDEPEDHIKEVEIKEKAFESLQTGENYQTLIDAIDAQLKNPDLTDEEMDSLLDKRQKLKFNSLKA
ncbi:MAG: hypothetical protein CW336_02540 [Bacteroidetes bacterium]|jgi:hypothetical protein|nr:hypothetical protein [Bacteroidota bacterium]MBO6057598.1 hypothetical protein [Bacteroidales bacterium]